MEQGYTLAHNPILPGFYPDPSICRVGEDFYLVNSTFAYFPGIPILHSRDLAHWEQIGNVLNRNSQLPLAGSRHSQGLYAPTIRYSAGKYYVICTNVSAGGNFYVWSKNPEGPWSEPVYLPEAGGIDPSLFFDSDGKCYYIGTHPNPEGCRYDGDWFIWIQELDLEQGKLVGEAKDVWNGAMRGVIWPEGPHLYRKDGYYYILHAEGGTGPEHCVAVCRSRSIWGPYENNRKNPIFTHRHLGKAYPIQYVGHGDLVDTEQGEWFMTMLAVRPQKGYTTMGRETFLAHVIWEDDWPVVNPGVGILENTVKIHLPEWIPSESADKNESIYNFGEMKKLGHEFMTLRNPVQDMYRLTTEGLKISCGEGTLQENTNVSYLAIRQQHHSFEVSTVLKVRDIQKGECAGLALVQNGDYQLRLEVTESQVLAILRKAGTDNVLAERSRTDDSLKTDLNQTEELTLHIRVRGLTASLWIGEETPIAKTDISALSTEVAGGFVGCTVGIYATANGGQSKNYVTFKELKYQKIKD